MWKKIVDLVKGLFGGGGAMQAGNRNVSVSAGENAGGIVIGEGNVVNTYVNPPARTPESPFQELEGLMPELLAEMKKDFADHPLTREFIVLAHDKILYNGGGVRYYEATHPHLYDKLRILENHGLIREITYNNTDRYRVSEEFARYLCQK